MCAEGGTGPDHREVIFESASPKGPFRPCRINPILTQRGLDPRGDTPSPVPGMPISSRTRMADGGLCFSGCVPTRKTVMTSWGARLSSTVSAGNTASLSSPPATRCLKGVRSASVRAVCGLPDGLVDDAFFIRNPKSGFYSTDADGTLTVEASPVRFADKKSPSAIGRWVTENAFELSVTLDEFSPQSPEDIAGLMLFQDDDCHIVFGKAVNSYGDVVARVDARSKNDRVIEFESPLDDSSQPLRLRIVADGKGSYSFEYAEGDGDYRQLSQTVPASLLSTRTAGNFHGHCYGGLCGGCRVNQHVIRLIVKPQEFMLILVLKC